MPRALAFAPYDFSSILYYRLLQPFEFLAPRGYELTFLPPSMDLVDTPNGRRLGPRLLDGIDMVIFPQTIYEVGLDAGHDHVALVHGILEDARERRIAIVYSPDDAVHLTDHANPVYERMMLNAPLIDLVRRYANGLITTTPILDELFHDDRIPCFVLPNAEDPARCPRRPGTSGEWRIGWGGGGSHAEDLLIAMPALERLKRTYPSVSFHVLGLMSESVDEAESNLRTRWANGVEGPQRRNVMALLDLFAALRRIDARHVPYVPAEQYWKALAGLDLDIGICPLRDSPFNRCKSCVKFYEYSMCGTMTIASRAEPYASEVPVLVDNHPDAWFDALEYWLRRRDERERQAEAARAWTLEHRNAVTLSAQWEAALRAILAEVGRA